VCKGENEKGTFQNNEGGKRLCQYVKNEITAWIQDGILQLTGSAVRDGPEAASGEAPETSQTS
jgi:hypothetical protein